MNTFTHFISIQQAWSHRAIPLLVLLLAVAIGPLCAQSDALDGSENVPVRITTNPQNRILGGAQLPPYRHMATFLANAFQSNTDDISFIQDSSVCSAGVPGTSDFDPMLSAEYDYQDGKVVDIRFSRIDPAGDRNLFSRKQFSYDDNGLVQYLYSRWNMGTSQWDQDLREGFSYDDEGRVTTAVTQLWSGADWVNDTRTMLTYTDENWLGEIVHAVWQNGQWVNSERSTAAYNDNGLPTTVTQERNDGSGWDTEIVESYEYDQAVEFILERYRLEMFDTTLAQLVPVLRETYGYNLRGFYTERMLETWDQGSGMWKNDLRDQFTFSTIGVWTSWTRQTWNNGWQNAILREFKFSNGRQVDQQQLWDTTANMWTMDRRRFVQFNEYGNLVWERNFELWNPVSEDWTNGMNTAQCRHFWSEDVTSSVSFQSENLVDCLFMNPYLLTSEIACLSLEPNTTYQARLHDQMGRTVFSQAFSGGSAFSIQNPLPAGMYYLFVADRNKVMYQGKMIISQ